MDWSTQPCAGGDLHTPTLAWVGKAGLAAAHYALQVGANNLAL